MQGKTRVGEEFAAKFLDISKCSSSRKVNHFYSPFNAEKELLKDCYEKFLDGGDKLILASKIVVNNKDGGIRFFSDQQITEDVSNKFNNNQK